MNRNAKKHFSTSTSYGFSGCLDFAPNPIPSPDVLGEGSVRCHFDERSEEKSFLVIQFGGWGFGASLKCTIKGKIDQTIKN